MNYFLENHIANILKPLLKANSKRKVHKIIEENLPKVSQFKYINFLNGFEDKIEFFKKDEELK